MEEDSGFDAPDNRAAQAEELEVLQSIYGDDCVIYRDEHFCQVIVHPAEGKQLPDLSLLLRVYFPDSYPSTSEPVAEVNASWLSEEMQKKLDREFSRLYSENLGNVVVFNWIEWLKEQVWLWEEGKHWLEVDKNSKISRAIALDKDSLLDKGDTKVEHCCQVEIPYDMPIDEKESLGNETSDNKSLEDIDNILGIFHGSPFTERKSTFQAHLAAVSSVDQVRTVMEALLQNRKIAGATHNIMAYRIGIPEKGTVFQDYNDDGETAAGKRLLHLLYILDAVDVVVVVSRWFGGILLGPDRFKYINNAARSLLSTCGYIKSSGQSSSQYQKSVPKPAPQKGKKKS